MVTWYCRTVKSPGCGAAWANGRRRSAVAKSSVTTGYAVPTYRVVPTPAATSALLERHPFLFLPALHPGLALNVRCATTCGKDGLPQRLVPPRVDACSLNAGAAMAAVKLSSPAVLTCSSNHGGQSRSKNSRQRIADGCGQVVKIKSAEASLRWRLQKKFAGSLDLRSNAGECWSSIKWIVCRTSAKATTEVGLEQADSSAADSVEAVEAVDSETQGEDDYPANYVLVSNNPDDLQKEIQKIEAENEELRKIIATSNAEAAEIGLLLRDTTVDVSRPRAGIQAPTANGVDAVSKPAPIQAPTAEASVQAPTAEGVDTVAIPAPTETPISPRTTVGDEAVSSYDRLQSAKLARSDVEESTKRTTNPFNIVFVSSEVSPYSKTGGLGDVCGALPLALAGRAHRVMVISPRYMNGVTDDQYAGAFDCQCRIKVDCFGGQQEVAFFHEYRDGVDWVFVDHPSYHRPGNPYGDTRGAFGDNQFRFTLLCHAACEAPLVLPLGGFTYGDKCLFIANDWHAGLVPVLLAAKYRKHGVYLGARCILAIHNLAHQGVEPGTTFSNLGLPFDWYGALEWVFPTWARKHALDKGEAVNIMKGAIVTSDRILTVSQGYAWEITTSEGGWGMDGLLRSRNAVLNGITNGVDVNDWNPATDRHISSQYVVDDLVGKAECKAALQKELGLPVRPEVPMIGFIGRLDYQKGPDVIQAGLPELMTDDVQMIMLGSGDPDVESWMGWAENNYRDKFRGWVGFSVPVAHRITAGCDILLMPSRFEPCGLNQLYAMRYGTVPVVHCTGGLRDTVQDYNPLANGGQGAGTGWTFSPLTKEAMMRALWIAIATYRNDKEAWLRIMKRGMSQDFSWEKAALQYEQVFEWAMIDPPYA